MSIFTRDMIQDLSCLELLNTVIENLEDDCIEYILQAKQVFQELRNLTLSHGCCPQVIQWKTIIFYSCERVLGNRGIVLCEGQKTELENVHTEIGNEGDETQNLFQNIFQENVVVSKQLSMEKVYQN
ncbi:uncharacterized protein LOC123704795 [Colias croceus]|uniref:uncharacterized protein LOC123704795 n=1 Tax=Colias crocea TaxID=72248 RepID=UPI001E27CEAE|nr:uncharacterized protein LOC123704795 [Colias croceus]